MAMKIAQVQAVPAIGARTEEMTMSLRDVRGMPVSTGNRDSLDRYEEAEELFLSYFADPLAVN